MDDLADALEEFGCERGFHDAAASGYRRLVANQEAGIGSGEPDALKRVLAAWPRQ